MEETKSASKVTGFDINTYKNKTIVVKGGKAGDEKNLAKES